MRERIRREKVNTVEFVENFVKKHFSNRKIDRYFSKESLEPRKSFRFDEKVFSLDLETGYLYVWNF